MEIRLTPSQRCVPASTTRIQPRRGGGRGEMVDALVLGTSGEIRRGSNPFVRRASPSMGVPFVGSFCEPLLFRFVFLQELLIHPQLKTGDR